MVALSSLGGAGWQFFDSNGIPLAGGKLYTYAAGTSTPAVTYTSSAGALGAQNANPIILDSAGRVVAQVWLENNSSYKFTLATSADVTLWTKDNVPGIFADTVLNAADFEYDPPFIGAVTSGYTVEDKLSQYVSVEDFGAVGDGVTNDTVAIQAALNSGAASVQLTGKTYVVNGTLTIPPGVTLIGNSVASEYFPTGPGSTTVGSCLSKLSTGTAGPIVILQSSSGIANLYLKHSKVNGATTGIVQVGLAGANAVYNSNINNVSIYGLPTTDITGTNTCYGIYYPNGSFASTIQRYFNRASNFYITYCDVGIRLGEECNANVFTSFITRQCYNHIELDANGIACVDNVFDGFQCANIGILPTTASTVFTLKGAPTGPIYNTFSGYATECNGAAFSISDGSELNSFFGVENEITPSFVSAKNQHSLWAQPENRSQNSQILMPSVAFPVRYDFGQGNLVRRAAAVSGTLPELNGTGPLVAANVNSKVFATFNTTVYQKIARSSFFCKLKIAAGTPGGGVGEGMVEVEFWYRVSDNSTSAAQFSVVSVTQRPSASNFIAGLYFLTGVAAATGFGLAVVGGNLGASSMTHLLVDIEITAFTEGVNIVRMKEYADIAFATRAATANDVTDAISLLTVADTTI